MAFPDFHVTKEFPLSNYKNICFFNKSHYNCALFCVSYYSTFIYTN